MATSQEIRRGGSALANGLDSDILLGPTITGVNLAAELALYPDAKPATVAWNRLWYFNPAAIGAIHVFLDVDGKWYDASGAEVT
jgi:orotate phosphoribosyltransferase